MSIVLGVALASTLLSGSVVPGGLEAVVGILGALGLMWSEIRSGNSASGGDE